MGAPLSHAPVTIDPPAVEDEPQTPASSSSNSTARQLTDDTSEQDLIDRTLDLSLVPEMMETDMEDLVGGRTITCPWHHYDFDLITGESPVGIKACTYDVRVEGGDVWVQAPDELEDDESWEVVEVKGVSEEYSDPPPARSTTTSQPTTGQSPSTSGGNHDGSSNPTPTALPQLPKTLIQSAILILKTPNPTQKISLTRQTTSALRQGTFQSILPTKKDLALVRQTFDKGEYEAKGLRGFTPPREGLKEVDSWGGAKRGKGGNEKSRILMIRELGDGDPSKTGWGKKCVADMGWFGLVIQTLWRISNNGLLILRESKSARPCTTRREVVGCPDTAYHLPQLGHYRPVRQFRD